MSQHPSDEPSRRKRNVKTNPRRSVPERLEDRLARRLATISHRVVVLSGKGGVGKSTVTVNVASALSAWGRRVGVLDGGIHAPDVPGMFGLRGQQAKSDAEGLRPLMAPCNIKVMSIAFLVNNKDVPVSWRGSLKHSLFQQFLADVQWGQLDYLIVDLPSSTGEELGSIAQLLGRPLWAIVVTTPQDVALLDSRKAVIFSRSFHTEILGIVENMSVLECPHCRVAIDLFKSGGGERAAEELGVPFLGRIPIDPQIVSSGDVGIPVVFGDPDCVASRVFEHLALTIDRAIRGN